jgi:4-hydroxybenzoate polyprenyltransferase
MFPLIVLLRPKQWVKNAFVFAPLFFSFHYTSFFNWQQTILAALAFAFVSSAIYVMNDIVDVESDKKHPRKKKRPVASGAVSVEMASLMAVISLLFSGGIGFHLPQACQYILGIYFVMNIAYSFFLKKIAILDVMIIASGFVLRVLMGAYAIGVIVSPWIVLSTFLLALFLGFGKRRTELVSRGSTSRASLGEYNSELLDQLITMSCTSALLSYAIYTVGVAQAERKTELVYTVAFVAFGLFRYLQHLYFSKKGESPEKILFSDPIFIINLLAWLAVTLFILS